MAAAKAPTKLQAAVVRGGLRFPRANRFRALGGDRKGQYSIRMNLQYRVCFRWTRREPAPAGADPLRAAGDAYDVEITGYH